MKFHLKLLVVIDIKVNSLENLFNFTTNILRGTLDGRKLTSLECHDIVCKIVEIVVVGGVRRSDNN